MNWTDRSDRFDDGTANIKWVSGIYQISEYDHTDEITGTEGHFYRAYVALDPLKADGIPGHVSNRLVRDVRYPTFEAAAADCENHSKLTA